MMSYSFEALVGCTEVMVGLLVVFIGVGYVLFGDDLVFVFVFMELLCHLYDDELVFDVVCEVVGLFVVGVFDRGVVAYLYAELFDEEGLEGVVVWDYGRVVFECFEDLVLGVGLFDRGFVVLGVDGGFDGDAFDCLGLGCYCTFGVWIIDVGFWVIDVGWV